MMLSMVVRLHTPVMQTRRPSLVMMVALMRMSVALRMLDEQARQVARMVWAEFKHRRLPICLDKGQGHASAVPGDLQRLLMGQNQIDAALSLSGQTKLEIR